MFRLFFTMLGDVWMLKLSNIQVHLCFLSSIFQSACLDFCFTMVSDADACQDYWNAGYQRPLLRPVMDADKSGQDFILFFVVFCVKFIIYFLKIQLKSFNLICWYAKFLAIPNCTCHVIKLKKNKNRNVWKGKERKRKKEIKRIRSGLRSS